MKLQGLAILFVILILPLSIIIGEYASFQIETFRLERLYDSRLITATHDALKTYQINTFNDELSDIVNNKLDMIEASATTFYNSLRSGFAMQGYTVEELQQYVPALVYTMYDGYYIYSPYTDVAQIVKDETNDVDVLRYEKDSKEMVHGFKPYVYYSCRYKTITGDDFVINYALDNYISVKGLVNGEFVNKSGYLVTIADSEKSEGLYRKFEDYSGIYTFYYNQVEILPEDTFKESLVVQNDAGNPVTKEYPYIKINGEKYYYEENRNSSGELIGERYFFHLVGGKRVTQVTEKSNDFYKYLSQLETNTSAINYCRNAYEFTNWVNENLSDLKFVNVTTEGIENNIGNGKIFENKKIEYSSSNFNLHRKEVIRQAIESNLSIAIANYNTYSNADENVNFQMPKLKETEWEMVENEISIISFLQGLNIGGKSYNGYTVVTNNKNEEFVDEESIYITTSDGYYQKVNDKNLEKKEFTNEKIQGVLDLDFETRRDGVTGKSYIPKLGLASYSSIVGQEKLNTKYDTIYEYLEKTPLNSRVKSAYYTALARERNSLFKLENPSQVPQNLENMAGMYDYLPITTNEKNKNGEGIVTNGLIRYYDSLNIDGKKNAANSEIVKWKDLSGNYDGKRGNLILQGSDIIETTGGPTGKDDSVSFDGGDDWINIGNITGLSNITVEANVMLEEALNGSKYYIISNYNEGGISLYINADGNPVFEVVTGSQINSVVADTEITVGKSYVITGVYDGSCISIYVDGICENTIPASGKIEDPTDNTVMAIGCNPQSNYGQSNYAQINLYSIKIYKRALLGDEIRQNVVDSIIVEEFEDVFEEESSEPSPNPIVPITPPVPVVPETPEEISVEIKIVNDDGVESRYITTGATTQINVRKTIEIINSSIEVGSIKYLVSTSETPSDDGSGAWTITLGSKVTVNKSIYTTNEVYLHIKVLDKDGNVVKTQSKKWTVGKALSNY